MCEAAERGGLRRERERCLSFLSFPSSPFTRALCQSNAWAYCPTNYTALDSVAGSAAEQPKGNPVSRSPFNPPSGCSVFLRESCRFPAARPAWGSRCHRTAALRRPSALSLCPAVCVSFVSDGRTRPQRPLM